MTTKKLLLYISLFLTINVFAQDNNKLWEKVEASEIKGETKTAIKFVDKIYKKAKKNNDSKNVIKSFIYKSKFNLILLENSEDQFIVDIQNEIKNNTLPAKAILQNIYAKYLLEFYNKNIYKFKNRTPVIDKGNDINTWDLQSIKLEIHKQFQNSISNVELLKAVDIKNYIHILKGENNALKYRPTLYDFLVNDAINFYTSHTKQSLKQENKNTLSKYIVNSKVFTKLNLSIDQEFSYKQTLKLYQDLEKFHLKKKNYAALFDILIRRLEFLSNDNNTYNYNIATNINSPIFDVINNTIESNKSHPETTMLSFYIANYYFTIASNRVYNNLVNTKNLKAEALKICDEIIEKFPTSEGAIKCKILKRSIESKFLAFETSNISSAKKPALAKVTYSNTDSLFLSVYKVPFNLLNKSNPHFKDYFKRNRFDYDSIIFKTIQTKTTYLEQHYLVDSKDDYLKHSAEVLIPKLENGNYILVFSNTKNIASKADYSYQTTARSNLFFTITDLNDKHEFKVTDREAGLPINNASISISSLNKNYAIEKTTNKNGLALELKVENINRNLIGLISHKGDSLIVERIYLSDKDNKNQEWNAAGKLVLDRQIYRPGQDVHFKGYLFQSKNGKRSVVKNTFCSILISDSKDNELKEFRLKTNEFGSVSGTYKLPKDIVTGEFNIELDEDYDYEEDEHPFWDAIDDFEYVDKYFIVEEYKRPKFEIKFDEIKENYKLSDSVFIQGKANSFFNSKISNAKVKYSVSDNDNYKNSVFATGEVKTNNDGEFTIPFLSKTINNTRNIKHKYSIEVDITDTNGETVSSKKEVFIGNYNLVFNVITPYSLSNNTSKPIKLVSKNLNNSYLPSSGELKIYKINEPYSQVFKRKWQATEFQLIEKDSFNQYFPYLKYNPKSFKFQEQVYETSFKTNDSLELELNTNSWSSGRYSIEGFAVNQDKDTVKVNKKFSYKNTNEEDNYTLFNYKVINLDFIKDGKAIIKLNSAFNSVAISARVFHKGKEIIHKNIILNKETTFNIPITKDSQGEFNVVLSTNKFGLFETKKFSLNVTETNDAFEIETLSFRNKLIPDAKEEWSFKIKALDKDVEVLASMYDEALDEFLKKSNDYDESEFKTNWDSRFELDRNYSHYDTPDIKSFDSNVIFKGSNNTHFFYRPLPTKYLELNYFGLNFRNFKYFNNKYLNRIKNKPRHNTLNLGNISGVILDNDGLPLPGVNVLVKGTTRGSTSDFDGFYSISAKADETLVFSYVGNTVERKVIKDTSINLVMHENALEEVLITALGIKREKVYPSYNITYNSVSDFNDDLARKLRTLPGVSNISRRMSSVTSSTRIVLRGNRSLSGNKQALIVVDGVIVDSNTLTNIDPNNISGVNVLKGAAGSALYGSQGSNGVIVISTLFGSEIIETPLGKTIQDISVPNLEKIDIRQNLKETAFFFPHLKTDSKNEISVSFKAPQALTRWKFQLLAHTKNLEYGYKKHSVITQKKLVVTPNLPRFLRQGDTIKWSSKITNLSTKLINGNAYLELYDSKTNTKISKYKSNPFILKNSASKEVNWNVIIPKNSSGLRYRIIAKTGNFSDGEEGFLPVLNRQILVTETLPIFIAANTEKKFSFNKLKNTKSTTLNHKNFSLEYSSNPLWFTFKSLPYLMQYPYDCAEQTFSKYYANTIANHILKSNSKIKAFITEDNKSIKEQTTYNEDNPFKEKTNTFPSLGEIKSQESLSIIKLKELQLNNGAFSWFGKNGNPNLFITNHIVASFGHLEKLGIKQNNKSSVSKIIKKAISFIDNNYAIEIAKEKKLDSNLLIHSLYARSFFMSSEKISSKNLLKINKHLDYLENNWITKSLYEKAMLSLIFKRFEREKSAQKILKALKQNSITNETFGTYWKENKNSTQWNEAQIETQVLIIEAFAEINKDTKFIDSMKLWVLNNKQSNNWKTTKATTEAIYALMIQGSDWLTVKQTSKIKIGSKAFQTDAIFGNFNKAFSYIGIDKDISIIEINNKSKSPGFGGVYWQYFEDLDKITSAETPLKLKKKLFKKTNTDKGEVITDITKDTKLEVGDLVRVRIELRSDRAMEFVHMKDMRAAGLEPVNVISKYKYQDGLGYYEATKDASTNFFFDYLPKGIYVFEYDLRVSNAGNMSNGITTIQSMYAPEFSSHSEGVRITVE
ncbi:alpha-2-macroglobulin family protein [Lacinutrix algicola]|uniref:alpha-2-macroglobulin family protein n=1 Tax=Lacinutrix algicola TaxID=342954 RepID=UPI0006E2AC4B|nr:alpha-2-macroglobulin family protein [Lacinutrix algicola]